MALTVGNLSDNDGTPRRQWRAVAMGGARAQALSGPRLVTELVVGAV